MVDDIEFYKNIKDFDKTVTDEHEKYVKESMITASYKAVESITLFLEDRHFFSRLEDFNLSRKFEDNKITITLDYKIKEII